MAIGLFSWSGELNESDRLDSKKSDTTASETIQPSPVSQADGADGADGDDGHDGDGQSVQARQERQVPDAALPPDSGLQIPKDEGREHNNTASNVAE